MKTKNNNHSAEPAQKRRNFLQLIYLLITLIAVGVAITHLVTNTPLSTFTSAGLIIALLCAIGGTISEIKIAQKAKSTPADDWYNVVVNEDIVLKFPCEKNKK